MARRALRKIGEGLDLSGSFLAVEDLPQPLDPATFFGRAAPLEVELGSGKGLFLSSAATAQPDRNFLGLEVARKYALHAAARLAQRELTNARMVFGDGLRVFREFLPDASLAAVHVYFPDPWWKARHRKRRVMNAEFLGQALRTLKPGAPLHFWTDVQEYFDTTLELIASLGTFEGPFEVSEAQPQHELDYRTHFERRMRLHNLPVYRSEFRKPG
jgi:tRNA (guanine-N7-)-methyltransferase